MGDLVVAEVQLGQLSIGGQALAEPGEGLVPHAQRVPLQHQPAVPTHGTRHQSRGCTGDKDLWGHGESNAQSYVRMVLFRANNFPKTSAPVDLRLFP